MINLPSLQIKHSVEEEDINHLFRVSTILAVYVPFFFLFLVTYFYVQIPIFIDSLKKRRQSPDNCIYKIIIYLPNFRDVKM